MLILSFDIFEHYRRRMLKEFRSTFESVEKLLKEIEERFEELGAVEEELERAFEKSLEEEERGEVSPIATLIDRGDYYLLVVDVPGVKEESITIDVYPDRVSVRAELDEKKVAKAFGVGAYRRTKKIMRGEYRLPEEIDVSRIETKRSGGRVYIKLPKTK
ncbi:MAG: Hsp20 family protein [Acidilobaceae archaeon]